MRKHETGNKVVSTCHSEWFQMRFPATTYFICIFTQEVQQAAVEQQVGCTSFCRGTSRDWKTSTSRGISPPFTWSASAFTTLHNTGLLCVPSTLSCLVACMIGSLLNNLGCWNVCCLEKAAGCKHGREELSLELGPLEMLSWDSGQTAAQPPGDDDDDTFGFEERVPVCCRWILLWRNSEKTGGGAAGPG